MKSNKNKSILKTIGYFFQYILYVILTMEKRNDYLQGQNKGMHVEKSWDSSNILPGSYTTYRYNPNKKPERDYLTWKEFWKTREY